MTTGLIVSLSVILICNEILAMTVTHTQMLVLALFSEPEAHIISRLNTSLIDLTMSSQANVLA